MSRLPYLRYDDLGPDGQRLWDALTGSRGSDIVTEQGGLTGPFNAFVHAPGVGRRLSALGHVLRFETSLEPRLSELAIITVAARWQAEFEWRTHSRMAAEHGVPAAVIEAIGRRAEPPFDAADERVIYEVAGQLADTGRLSPDAFSAARQLLPEAGLVELVSLCGYYTLISYLLNAFTVPLPPGARPAWPPEPD